LVEKAKTAGLAGPIIQPQWQPNIQLKPTQPGGPILDQWVLQCIILCIDDYLNTYKFNMKWRIPQDPMPAVALHIKIFKKNI